MKTSVIVLILIVFGLVAAGAAVILVQSVGLLRPNTPEEADVLVATADLEARTPLVESHVAVKRMQRTGLPVDTLSNWSQVAGKVLKVAVVKDQPLVASHFAAKDSVDEQLKKGMLAFPVHLSRRVTAENLFYPGCVVDVFATFPLQNRENGEAIVFPLLQGIRVLGVADETVAQPREADAQARRSATNEAIVTLEVNSEQAGILQLAMQQGTLGLAMRNPTDTTINPADPIVVKDGRFKPSGEAESQTLALARQWQQIQQNTDTRLSRMEQMVSELQDPNKTQVAAAPAATPQPPPPLPPPPILMPETPAKVQSLPPLVLPPKPVVITVIRGRETQDAEFERGDQPQPEPAGEARGG